MKYPDPESHILEFKREIPKNVESNKPYYRKSEELDSGTYVRIGRSTLKATYEMIQELSWQSPGLSFDMMPVYHATENDIDMQRVMQFLQTRKNNSAITASTEMLKNYRILVDEHSKCYPTVAGLLLFGKDSNFWFSEAMIICTHFHGISGGEAIASRDMTGPLFEQFHSTYDFILSRLNTSFTIQGAKREETLEIPEVAIRELLLNAIIHRNYHLKAPIEIAIYQDRIEIFSPGNFPGPLLQNQLEMGLTFIRNRVIARVFREFGYIEKLGSGFSTLFQSYRKRGLKPPIVMEGQGFVKCILPRPSPNESKRIPAIDRYESLMQLFYLGDEVRISDVMEYLNISRSGAHRLLSDLVASQRLQRTGKGAGTRYIRRG